MEVKASRHVRPEDLTALGSFGEDYPQSDRHLLYRGEDRLKRDNVLCLPCEEFLTNLRPGHFPNRTGSYTH